MSCYDTVYYNRIQWNCHYRSIAGSLSGASTTLTHTLAAAGAEEAVVAVVAAGEHQHYVLCRNWGLPARDALVLAPTEAALRAPSDPQSFFFRY